MSEFPAYRRQYDADYSPTPAERERALALIKLRDTKPVRRITTTAANKPRDVRKYNHG